MTTQAARLLIAIICVIVLVITFYPAKEQLATLPDPHAQVSVMSPFNGKWTNASKTKYLEIRVFKTGAQKLMFANVSLAPNVLGSNYRLRNTLFSFKLDDYRKGITYASLKSVKTNEIIFSVKNNDERFYRITGIFKFATVEPPKPVIATSLSNVLYPTIVPVKTIPPMLGYTKLIATTPVQQLPYIIYSSNGNTTPVMLYSTIPAQQLSSSYSGTPVGDYITKDGKPLPTRTACADMCIEKVRNAIPGALDTMFRGDGRITTDKCSEECKAQYGKFVDPLTGELSPRLYAAAPRQVPAYRPDGSIAFYQAMPLLSETPLPAYNSNVVVGYKPSAPRIVSGNTVTTSTYPTTTPYKQAPGIAIPITSISVADVAKYSIISRWVYFDNRWVYFDIFGKPMYYNTSVSPENLNHNAIPIQPTDIEKFSIVNKWVYINNRWVYYDYSAVPIYYDTRIQ